MKPATIFIVIAVILFGLKTGRFTRIWNVLTK